MPFESFPPLPERLPRAMIFDLDGTLIDSLPDIATALNRVLEEEGKTALPDATVAGFVGDGVGDLVSRGLHAVGIPVSEPDMPDWMRRFRAHYADCETDRTRPYEGVPEMLAALGEAGVPLAVCTNKPEAPAKRILEGVGLSGHFETVLGADSLGGVKKPDPAPLLSILDGLGVPPDGACMVGDSTNDVLAAKRAGMASVVVSFGYTKIPARDLGADHVIDRFGDLAGALAVLAGEGRGF